jgi:hypothetical protein
MKVLGYIINREVRKSFGKNFEVVIARAPPGQSPDRFYAWIRLSEEGKRNNIKPEELDMYLKKKLPRLLKVIRMNLEKYTLFGGKLRRQSDFKGASLQATVIPIQKELGMTYEIINKLSAVPVEYPEDQMDKAVAGEFSDDARLRPNDKNVTITDDGHRIVFYNEESEQQKLAMAKFEESKRKNALISLIGSLSMIKEDYHRTLRRLYADVTGIDKDSDEAKAVIPDDIAFSQAAKKIISKIKEMKKIRIEASYRNLHQIGTISSSI